MSQNSRISIDVTENIFYKDLTVLSVFVDRMGSQLSVLGTNVSFQFDKKYTTIYETGELVSGTANFCHDGQLEIKLKEIFIELVGELVYTTHRGSGHSKTNDIQVVPFYLDRQIVRSDAKNAKENFLLESGDHTWPFEFRLHDNLPPTLEQTRHNGPYIRYVVRVQMIVSDWYQKNIQRASFITVRCHQSSMIPMIKSRDDHTNRKDIRMQAFLQQNAVCPGEKLTLCFDLHNPNRTTITRISITLVQQRLLGPAGKEEINLFKKDLNDIEHLQKQIEFHVPQNIAPTCSCVPPKWSSRKPLAVSYELRLEAHLPGLLTNLELKLPIHIN